MNRTVIAATVVVGALLAVPASAADLIVGPGHYSTIQAAVTDAQPGDRILVGSGDHAGAVVMKAVEILGMGDARIVAGSLNRGGKTMGFQIGAADDGANGNGVTISHLTFAETVDLPVYSRGANHVTVSHNLLLNAYQGVTNRGGSGWVISHNTFRDLRTGNGGGIAIVAADHGGRDVQHNLVTHNKITGTLHVAPTDGGGYSGVGIALFADFRYGQAGASSIAFNRVVKNSVALVSDNADLVDVAAFELSIGVDEGADPSEHIEVIHHNVIGFNNFRRTETQIGLTPTAIETSNTLYQNLSDGVTTGGGDFDGDGKADIAAFRPSDGIWSVRKAGAGPAAPDVSWGNDPDVLVPGDYDGDGKIDVAVFRPSNGYWFILKSTGGEFHAQWGNDFDVPVPGDYDGDGKTDIAVFRPSNGYWFILKSSGGELHAKWGTDLDVPVQGDYDGDRTTDIAVFEAATGTWHILYVATRTAASIQYGSGTDLTVPADYDGDGKTDIAVFRPSNGYWFILKSSGGQLHAQYGNRHDVPVPGDYDGDGKADIAVFRAANSTWYILDSSTGWDRGVQFGDGTVIPMLKR